MFRNTFFADFSVSSPSYIIYNDLSPSGWALLRCFNHFSAACAPWARSFAYTFSAPAWWFVHVTSLRPRRQLGQRDFQRKNTYVLKQSLGIALFLFTSSSDTTISGPGDSRAGLRDLGRRLGIALFLITSALAEPPASAQWLQGALAQSLWPS